ncbi:MAG: nickel-dependent hydrogenase large subunit [bacterium]|nr:nickel-dependent hydrogenase large subunit [bacterium]
MTKRIVIDPVTRLEGHYKIEVELEKDQVKNAWVSGTMARGIEALLKDKDPRDAPYVTSRFCGVCYSVHQICSARAIESAVGAKVPYGGILLRNLVMGAQYLYDHPLHFYQLSALDYLDIMAVANYKGSDKALLGVKDKIVGLVNAKDTFPLTPRYEPDEYCVKDPEVVTTLVKHYLDALIMHAKARNMGAIFGGRTPHYQSIVAGGFTQQPDAEQVKKFRTMLDEQKNFIENVYLKDVLAVGTGPLFPLAKAGLGAGHLNYLAYGGFEMDPEGKTQLFPGGVILGLNPASIKVDPCDPAKITESVKYGWYQDAQPGHPKDGRQVFNLDKKEAYSFSKAPRYDGKPMEVGPMARLLVAKNPDLLDLVAKGAKPGVVARHAARALETKLVLDACYKWIDQLQSQMAKPGFRIHDTDHWEPTDGMGAGFYEAPRGALGHWISIKDKKIANYSAVVPTTWNSSPRDESGVRGQFEEALIGAPVKDPKNPINLVRIIRSFDPCSACAIHLIDPQTNEVRKFIVE